jgi:hypothetical protein
VLLIGGPSGLLWLKHLFPLDTPTCDESNARIASER